MATLFSTSVDGTRIAYDVTGSGPALMLLHGAGKTRRDWHKLGYVERLKDDFTVITVDIRGAGDSDCLYDIADYGIEKICEDLYAVADACGVEKFAVWGFSFGGNIARYLGAWSDRVTAIAAIGVPFGPAVHEEFDRFIDQFLKKWESVILAAREGSAPQSKGKIKGQIPALAACFQAMRDWPSVEPSEVTCPVLLLTGTKNRSTIGWVEANRSALDASGVQLEVIEELTHDQEFTKIDQVYPVVSAFFKNQGGDRMAGHDVQSVIDRLRKAEAEAGVDKELIHILECRGRECIGATYIQKANDAAKDAEDDGQFLNNLAKTVRMLKWEGDAVYMIYPKCYCHRLKGFEGEVPHSYCYCSAGWFKEMFEQALGRPIEVKVEASVLRGDETCRLRVLL